MTLTPKDFPCSRCHTNCELLDGHMTAIPGTNSGLTPLCQQCWAALTPEARLPYYLTLFDSWPEAPYPREKVVQAVLAERR
jgi:hypothetical protein